MDEATLPERLRYLSERFAVPAHAEQVGVALRGAADELERLAGVKTSPFLWDRLRELADAIDTGPNTTDPEQQADAGTLRAAATRLEALERAHEREARPLDVIGAELADAAGVPAPTPAGRRFAARYGPGKPDGSEYFRGEPPTPGSFVLLGPVGSAWRVLAVDELAGHATATHVLELEPVDPHDVPVHSRVETVPMPVEELDGDVLYDSAEATS